MKYLKPHFQKTLIKDYKFYRYDLDKNLSFLDITLSNGEEIKLEFNGYGKSDNNKWNKFTILNNSGIPSLIFKVLCKKIITLLDLENYEFVQPRYGMSAYFIVYLNEAITVEDLEILFSENKEKIKKQLVF